MSGASNIAGYMTPSATVGAFDDAFEDFLHDVLAGLAGIAGDLVRPLWQPNPPNLPGVSTNWLAFGVTAQRPEGNAYALHDPAGNGSDSLTRHEDVDVPIRAYGPNAMRTMGLIVDGLQLGQNREVLRANGVGVRSMGDIVAAPVMIKELWYRRRDATLRLTREIRRTYTNLSIASAAGTINNEHYVTELAVAP